MKKILICCFLLIVVFTLSACTKEVSVRDQKDITKDITDYKELCGKDEFMADSCYEGVAFYNNDIKICDMISREINAQGCKTSLNTGEFMFREYTSGEGCVIDNRRFTDDCKTACLKENKNFENREKIGDPLSVGSYAECGEKIFSFIACYCY